MTYDTINDGMTMAGGAEGALLANRYRIVRQLGQGGMGSVWLAEDTQLDNKQFAIKMLPSILVSNKRAYRQLKDEALVAMKLTHSNIVTLRAFEENNGNPFLVMDYIDGQTLDDFLAEKGKLSEDETTRLLKPIAAALDYAHDKGIVHRDVKPGNVMIAKDGTPFILDFGIAREIQETMTRVTGKLSSGTLLYMSPEQLNGEPPKSAQDVYSFAAMVYECLKGEPPFSRGQIEHQILNNMPPPLAGTSVSLSCSIMSGLAKKPEDRPPTCAAVLNGKVSRRVAEPCRKEGGQQVGGTGGSPIHGGLRKLIAALVVIALAVCGGLWWQLDEKETARRHELDRIAEQKAEEERKARLAEEAEAAARKSATEIRIEAVIQKDKVDRIKDEDGFKVRKDALSDIFARADALFDEKVRRWSEAAVQFTNYVDECNALIRLDGERKAAAAAHTKAEESKKEAEKADAGEYSTVRWSEAVKLLDSANVEFGQMRFASAVETFASAESQFNACAKYAVIERRHRAEETAAKAKAEQERNRAEAEAKELAEQKARECERRAKGSVSVELNEIESSVTDYPSCVNEGFVDISDKFIGDEKEQVSVCEYGNFVLRFEYVHVDDFFGGIDIRTPSYKAKQQSNIKGWPRYDGMCSIPLIDDGGSNFYDKDIGRDRLKAFQYTGSLYGISPARRDNVGKQIWGRDKNFSGGGSYARKSGQWNFMEVKVVGSDVEVYLNGQQINKCDVSVFEANGSTLDGHEHRGLTRRRGHIRFVRFAEGRLTWRNVRILQLPDNAKIEDVTPAVQKKYPLGFERYFTGHEADMGMWKGVTTEEKFDNPIVRQKADSEKRRKMQEIADAAMRQHWFVRNGSLFFDGFKGGYSIATRSDYGDFEMWADWRIMSFWADSGLYLRGAPQVQIWDAHNQWHIGSGGLFNNKKNSSRTLKIADCPIGDWNRFHIIMRGDKVTVWLNGELVVDNVTMENYWDRRQPIFSSGQIELQCHGDPIEWRNIFIKRL